MKKVMKKAMILGTITSVLTVGTMTNVGPASAATTNKVDISIKQPAKYPGKATISYSFPKKSGLYGKNTYYSFQTKNTVIKKTSAIHAISMKNRVLSKEKQAYDLTLKRFVKTSDFKKMSNIVKIDKREGGFKVKIENKQQFNTLKETLTTKKNWKLVSEDIKR